jgi:hypothetical protein
MGSHLLVSTVTSNNATRLLFLESQGDDRLIP